MVVIISPLQDKVAMVTEAIPIRHVYYRGLKSFVVGIIFTVFFLFLSSQKLRSQSQITFRQLSVKEGLSQNSAISVSQDSTGYLWIATQDGLNKYDGRKFTTFPFTFVDITKPDYSNLGKVYTDRRGGLWIIPIDKIPYKLNPIQNTFEPLSGITDASIIYQDLDFNIWIGTYSHGLYVLNANTILPEQVIGPSEIAGTIYNIAQSTSGELLLAGEREIIQYNPKTKKIARIKPKDINGNVINQNFSAITLDAKGRQWIGTYGNGLYFRENGETIFHRISEFDFATKLPDDLNVVDLDIDSKRRLWVASYGNGLYMVDFNANRIASFKAEKHNPKALHYNDILCIYEDYTGTLWFGTDGAGISYYDEHLEKFNSLINVQTPENINIDVVRAITVDKEENVWIGTSGKGLTAYTPATNQWKIFRANRSNENTIASDRIMSLLIDDDERIWIGTQEGGLSILDTEGDFLNFSPTSKPPLSANTVWCIYKDTKNRIWMGTREQGILQFDSNKGEIVKYQANSKGLPSNNIRVITEDDMGNLWIGTESDGLVFFDMQKETFTTYQKSEADNSISSNNIKSIYHAPDGILWVGTNGGGLNAYDITNQKFYNYTIENGLANDVIYAILPDKAGNLWLSSNKGISKFTSGNTLNSEPEITNYNSYAGLAAEFNTGAHHIDEKGNLYFGGLDGLYWFKPEEIRENQILPKTTITSFEVSNEPYPIVGNTQLSHDQNTISFTFSSLQYSLPEKNTYQYRLVNYDRDWVHAGNTNFARYTQLPPKNYTFQVKSSNYDGVWNEKPESFYFTIAPPWYLTTLAKIIYGILFLATIFGVYSYLRWRWRMQLNMQLKEEETERLQKLNDFKSNLYTNIAHEFKTPLTLIAGPVEQKLQEENISDSDLINFSMVKRNTKRLTALVDQVLDLAKLENGKLQLQLSKGNLGLFLHAIAQSFDYQAVLKQIDYTVKIQSIDDAVYDEDIIEKITTNLLSNAFKYCPENGRCSFTVTKHVNHININVKNTTMNGSKLDLEKLFTRFYQYDNYAKGMGVGLSLVKELVTFYKGKIRTRMEPGEIIHFELELPLKSYVEEDTIIKEIKVSIIENENITADATIDSKVAPDNSVPILLIVEDQAEIRAFIKNSLKREYQILEAENGREGLKISMSKIPDIIISDIRMPVLDGIELCNTLKNDELTNHIPIILLTANSEEENELKGLASGADAFMIKPFKIHLLEQRIDNLIEGRKALRNRYAQEFILKPKNIAITPVEESFLNKIQEILDLHLADPQFSAELFSKKAGISRMQLHRKLLSYTGLSTSAFIRSQRLKQALHILRTSDSTINEIAYTVGFNTPSYFMKCFKETFKKTPSEYLQSID